MSIRAQILDDLAITLEDGDGYGLPVELTGPNGQTQVFKKGSTTEKLMGQVLYNTFSFNPDTGEDMVADDPIVVLALESLDVIPQNNETWLIRIPGNPRPDAQMVSYVRTPTKAMKFNSSIGFVRIYLSSVQQS